VTGFRLSNARKQLYDLRVATFASVLDGQGGQTEQGGNVSFSSTNVPRSPPPAWSAMAQPPSSGPTPGQEEPVPPHAPPTGPPPPVFPDAQLASISGPTPGDTTQHAPPLGPPPSFPDAQTSHTPPAGPPPSGAPSNSSSVTPAGGETSPGTSGKREFASSTCH
jgi:hypothetical protein